MTVYFVNRHQGAIIWAKQALPHARFLNEIDPAIIRLGDKVFGILPIDLAADVCARGAEFHALIFNRDGAPRGAELKADELIARNARFVRYHVETF